MKLRTIALALALSLGASVAAEAAARKGNIHRVPNRKRKSRAATAPKHKFQKKVPKHK